MEPLSRLEMFDLAVELAEKIKEQLNMEWYNKTEIVLSINWSTEPKLGAWASIGPTTDAPTRHTITLTYELIETIYSEALDFALFAFGRKGEPPSSGVHLIADQFELLQAAEFMFESGITFVIFHELAHINQCHGSIRAKYAPAGSSPCTINEFESLNDAQMLTGDLASIYHATEIAADFEALDWMATNLEAMFQGEDFCDHAYLQCAIVSCIMLMFNSDNPVRLDPLPAGSHPFPVPRMDLWVKAYAERTVQLSPWLQIEVSTEDVINRLMDASFLALLKWMTRRQLPDVPQYTDFFKTVRAHPNFDRYMREIIKLWDVEYRSARNSRKFGGPLAVLYFSDEFRREIGSAMNRESLSEHVQHCFDTTEREQVRLAKVNDQ
jgi:hypothetical protein